MKTVLISGGEDAVPAPYLQEIRDAGIELECKACTNEDEVVEFSRDADLIWMFGPNRGLTPGALERLPKCKGIFRSGSGLDALPVEAAQKRGIRVYNTPESIAESVAEHAVALLFALVRQIPYYDASVKAGKWGAATHIRWHISGRTLGLVGYGQKDPLVEYKKQSFDMFQDMLDRIDTNTVKSLFHLEIVNRDEQEEVERLERLERQRANRQAAGMAFTGAMGTAEAAGAEAARHTPFVRDQPKVKPNDPCYCGSGKKFKKCHGAGA